jgi:hypothetical protein
LKKLIEVELVNKVGDISIYRFRGTNIGFIEVGEEEKVVFGEIVGDEIRTTPSFTAIIWGYGDKKGG